MSEERSGRLAADRETRIERREATLCRRLPEGRWSAAAGRNAGLSGIGIALTRAKRAGRDPAKKAARGGQPVIGAADGEPELDQPGIG